MYCFVCKKGMGAAFRKCVKARVAFAHFQDAIEKEQLYPGKTLLDATSGNTGIAYARIGRIPGILVSLCLPENASSERKSILHKLGLILS